MSKGDSHPIGVWRFWPNDGVLGCGSEKRRLEDRAARTLALLCGRRGDIVTQAEILEEIWQGRSVSANSVAIVIGDIRRALGEDARSPTHLETIPKRGYRLRAEPEPAAARDPSIRTWRPLSDEKRLLLAGGGALCALGLGAVLWRAQRPAVLRVLIEPVLNDTGRADLDRLARSLGMLVDTRVAALPRVRVLKSRAFGVSDRLRCRLILWDGQPTLSLELLSVPSGAIVWAGMAEGPPASLASNTVSQVRELAAKLHLQHASTVGSASL